MQNKPNSRKTKMNLNFYLEKGYENKPCFRVLVKQTQSNPISKGAFILFCGALLSPKDSQGGQET